MASEIQLAYGTSGRTLYAVIRSAVGQVWNGSAFETYTGGNWATYAVSLTEQGTSGYYAGTFPTTSAGVYLIEVRDRSGGSPATTDPLAGSGEVEWSGTALVPLSSRLPTTSYTAPLDAAGTRTAVGLASANLDTQIATLATASSVAALNNLSAAQVNAEVDTALSDVGLTTTRTGYLDNLSAGAVPTLAQILAGGDVDGYSLEQTLKLCLAALAGKLSGAAGTTVTIRAADDSKTRITATVDSNGNRTAVTLDAAG